VVPRIELARRHPRITVDANVLYIDNGQILTSAGAAAGLDLCLHLVRRDLVGGAMGAYISGGLGLWELPFAAVGSVVAYQGLRSHRFIGLAW
jgi:hypothetical protein